MTEEVTESMSTMLGQGTWAEGHQISIVSMYMRGGFPWIGVSADVGLQWRRVMTVINAMEME